jgi:hypothetical protein|tara:strand:- start:1106 stop:1342 length:237 start_codon:yes stop_codon:yes gene_type:complete
MKKLERKKSKSYNNNVLEKFEKLMNRDKSNDIIRGNVYLNDKKKYEKLFIDLFYEKMKEFFVDYLDEMNKKENLLDSK